MRKFDKSYVERTLELNLIDDTIIRRKGYAHIEYTCKFRKSNDIKRIYKDDKEWIAEWLDGWNFNFGGRDISLIEIDGMYEYKATIEID